MLLPSFAINLTEQLTLSVTRPFDSSPELYYKWSIVTMRLSCTIKEIWRLKSCTHGRGHEKKKVESKEKEKGKKERKRIGRKEEEKEKKGRKERKGEEKVKEKRGGRERGRKKGQRKRAREK